MARSRVNLHSSMFDPDSSMMDCTGPAVLLYVALLARRDMTKCGTLKFTPIGIASRIPGIDTEHVAPLLTELAQTGHILVDWDHSELFVWTYLHYDGVLAQGHILKSAAVEFREIDSKLIRDGVRQTLPPEVREQWPAGIEEMGRKDVQDLIDECGAASYKPTVSPPVSPPVGPTTSPPVSPPAWGPVSPTEGVPSGSGGGGGGGGSTHAPASNGCKPPQPHAERGEPEQPPTTETEHHGQHSNCRRCGTNPRAQGTNPRGPKPPDPVELQHQAADAIAKRHSDPDCDCCHDTGFLDAELQDDQTWGPAPPCPDCTSTTEAKVRAALDPGGAT